MPNEIYESHGVLGASFASGTLQGPHRSHSRPMSPLIFGAGGHCHGLRPGIPNSATLPGQPIEGTAGWAVKIVTAVVVTGVQVGKPSVWHEESHRPPVEFQDAQGLKWVLASTDLRRSDDYHCWWRLEQCKTQGCSSQPPVSRCWRYSCYLRENKWMKIHAVRCSLVSCVWVLKCWCLLALLR